MIKPLALWAVPRSASTAFERMMIERGDHQVLDEPYSAAYYHGPEQVSRRFAPTMGDAGYAEVWAGIDRAASAGAVFVKDMAYHLSPILSADLLDRFTSTFLVRDPRWSVPSMARIWPDLTLEEAGFHRLEEAYELVAEGSSTPPPLIDSADLLADPAAVVGRWCRAVGIEPMSSALTWTPGMQPQWRLWPDWYHGAAATSGFAVPDTDQPPPVHDPELVELIAACRPVYDRLLRYRLLD